MKLFNSPLPDSSSHHPENRPRKVVAGAYLVVSLFIHLVAIVVVLLVSTQQKYGPAVTYIDINSITESVPPATPVIHAPAPQSENIKTEEPVPLPETPSESTETEAPTVPVQPPVSEVQTTSLGRGMTSGYFSSFAEGKNLRYDIREYYFVLLEKINNNWWLKAETLKETASHDGVVMFVIGRDGALVDVQLSKGTGSRLVDRAIIEVIKDTAPFPPLPASFPLAGFRAPLRIAAPLHLFSVRSIR